MNNRIRAIEAYKANLNRDQKSWEPGSRSFLVGERCSACLRARCLCESTNEIDWKNFASYLDFAEINS